MNNIMWFIFAGIILLMTMIGYYAEKTDFGRNVDDDNKKSKKEKKSKNNKKEEPAGIPVLENIDIEKNIGNNSVIENTNPLGEEVTNIENNNLENVSLETVNEINEENNSTDTVTNDNQEVTQLENSQKEDIISEPVIEEVVTDIVEEKQEDVVSEPATEDVITEVVEEKQEDVSEPTIEDVTTETVEEEKIEDNVSNTVVEDEKNNETNEVQEELPSIDELMNPTTEDEKEVSDDLKVEENIESAKNNEAPLLEKVEEDKIDVVSNEKVIENENTVEESVVEEIDAPSLKIEELPNEVEYKEEIGGEIEVDDSHPVEQEVGISEIDAENLPVKIEESVTVSENNNSDIPEVSIDEIEEQKDVTVEEPQKKSWFGKKKSKKVDIPVDIGIREADSNEVLENTKEPDNNSNDEDDIWKF
ncbi:MAG: hypothetical protein PUA68_04135 [Bacilli bacterium]|nr:hypothetical protein [Bacilli bacterium]